MRRHRQTVAVSRAITFDRAVPWLARLTWIGVAAVGGQAIDRATTGRSAAVADVARYGGGAWWVVGVLAMAIPAVVSLTATRISVPVAIPAAVIAWVAGADIVDAVALLGLAVLATAFVLSGELGRAFVQASAYGEEDRYPLRPPAAYALVAGLTWAAWAACVLAGPLLLAAQRWVPGGVLTALAVIGGVWAWPRWHLLSRRWFVLVPVGIVVHDHLVLSETLMLRRDQLAAVHLAPAGTGAADLTGPATGHAIELVTHGSVTALLSAGPDGRRGAAIHLTACLISPTRPGQVLRSAGRRRLPVG